MFHEAERLGQQPGAAGVLTYANRRQDKIMRRLILAGFSVLLPCATAFSHELVTPPVVPHPMPQGVPYLVVGAQPHPVRTLRFAIIHGRRALIDAETDEVVYYLNP